MVENNVAVANFNVTFGNKEEPLLKWFEDIIYPAFTSGIERIHKSPGGENADRYFFMDVSIVDVGNEDYVLKGKFVKDTTLDVYTVMKDGKLLDTDQHHPSAPYSAFYIFLRNHRMVLIRNQKGSPNIKSFGLTARNILDKFVREKNKTNKENNNPERLPYPILNVVGIPMREDLDKALLNVIKMKKLRLRFYPLNGDLDTKLTGLIDGLAFDLRKAVDAKTGNITINSPENKQGVAELIDSTQGVVEATLEVEYEGKKKGTISNNNISEKITWNIEGEDINNEKITGPNMLSLPGIQLTSEENKKIYNKFLNILKKYLK